MPCLDYDIAEVPAKGTPVKITDRSGVARYNKYADDVPERGVVAETWGHPSQCYVRADDGKRYFAWATQIKEL